MHYGPNFKMSRCSFRHVVNSLINENSVPYNFLNVCDIDQRETLYYFVNHNVNQMFGNKSVTVFNNNIISN